MSEKQEVLLRQYCAHVLLKYGFEFSTHDPVVPALYIIYRELHASRIGNEELAKGINNAVGKMNPVVFSSQQTLDLKVAENFKWFIAGLTIVTMQFMGLIWWNQHHDVQKAEEILKTSSELNQMLLNAKKDESNFMYWEFSKAKGKIILNYKEYVQVSHDTVRVYLGKSD